MRRGYHRGVARRVRPLAEREARWAFALAALGSVSLYVTLPAAVVLAVRAIRGRRGGDGSEPAIGVLALGLVWLAFLMGYPVMHAVAMTALSAEDGWRAMWFLGGLLALAAAIGTLARFLVHGHPERWMSQLAAFAGVIAVLFATALQAVEAAPIGLRLPGSCGSPVSSNADCVGRMPWLAVGPAAVVGLAWFLVSFLRSRAQAAR